MKNPYNLDRTTLRLFDALMETGNLTQAAAKVGIPVSSASRAVKELQDVFGTTLFTRWINGSAPTRMAKELHRPIRDVLDSMDRLLAMTPAAPEELRQSFSIACVDNAAFSILGPVLPAIFEKAPHISIETPPVRDDIFVQLKAGNIDMAIFPFQEIPEGFHFKKLYTSKQCLVVGVDHPLVREFESGEDIPPARFKAFRRIEISLSHSKHWQKFRHQDDLADQEIALRTPYFLFAALMLAKTNLTLRLPEVTARQLEDLGILRAFPFPQKIRTNEPLLIWHDRMHHEPVAQWIRSMIINEHSVSKSNFFAGTDSKNGKFSSPRY